MTPQQPLAGRSIVITRPAGEAQRLQGLIRDAGGVPLLYPGIEILDPPDPAALDAVIDRLEAFDLAIFISPSAVHRAMTRIRARRTLPGQLRCAAIGPGGARALQSYGVRDVITPAAHSVQYDSESLLAADFLQNVGGLRVAIFRGDGGRELLRETLMARGALVEAVTCYRRSPPQWDSAPLLQAWARGEVAAVIATSSEGLINFYGRLDAAGKACCRDTPLIVPHPRIAAAARALGMQRIVESAAGDEALMAAALRPLCG